MLSPMFISVRRFIPILLGCLMLIAGTQFASAAPLPAAPQLAADSYVLFDHLTGRVIASKDPDKQIEPASLTKLMTAYIVSSELQRGSVTLDEPVRISEQAQSMPGSRMFIEANTIVSLGDLMRGLIIQSGNDASVALAEHIAASEAGFVDMMNRAAAELGMNATRFANSSGLPDPQHYTTANDLAKIASAIITEHPETYKMYSELEFTYNDITQKNRNTLLWRDESVDGMKTGHTEAAGYCLVSSAVRDGMRLISIVLGASSDKTRIAESQRLLNYGFRFFRTRLVYAAGETIAQTRVWSGKQDIVSLGVADDLHLTLPRDTFDTLTSQVEVSDYVRGPIRIGQVLGGTVLRSGEEIISDVPLLALEDIEKAGIFKRMRHSIQRLFQ